MEYQVILHRSNTKYPDIGALICVPMINEVVSILCD